MNAQFLSTMIQAARLNTTHIPIIAEDSFRFPSKDMLDDLKDAAPKLLANAGSTKDVEPGQIIELIKDMFKEIAVVFAPQDYSSTETLLNVKAQNIAQWLLGSKLQIL